MKFSEISRIFYKEVLYKEGSIRIGKNLMNSSTSTWDYKRNLSLLKKNANDFN